MPPAATARLRIACPDRPGIVAAATAFVAEHRGNIIDLQQHTDHTGEAFFLRLELAGVDLARDEIDPPSSPSPSASPCAGRWTSPTSGPRQAVAELPSRSSRRMSILTQRQHPGWSCARDSWTWTPR